MKITPERVRLVATLARLELSDGEATSFARQLTDLVRYFEELGALDTEGVDATSHAVPVTCRLRADEVAPALERDDILKQAPAREGDFFTVPKVIE